MLHIKNTYSRMRVLKMSRSRTGRKSRKCERQVREKDGEAELLQRHPKRGKEMAPLLRLMSFYGLEQLHNVQLGNVGDSGGEIFGPLVTFSRGLLRNRAAADATVGVVAERKSSGVCVK